MDASLNLFTQLYAANVMSTMNANGVKVSPSTTMMDRLNCHRTLIKISGEMVAREHLMTLLLQSKGNASIKRRMWDEFDMAIDNYYSHF